MLPFCDEGQRMKQVLIGLGVVAVGVVAAVVLNFMGVFAFTSMDGQSVAREISGRLSESAATAVHVTCPQSIPEKRGGIEDCQANAGHGTTLVRVVQEDSRGHYHYEVGNPTVLAPVPVDPPGIDATSSFRSACYSSNGNADYCQCLLTGLEANYTIAEIDALQATISGGGKVSQFTADLMATCSRQ
jgi:hypothetical protein